MQLRHLVERVGADHVVLGTDYPFDMGDRAPIEHLRQSGLDAKAVAAISAETARDTLRVGCSASDGPRQPTAAGERLPGAGPGGRGVPA